VDDYTFHLRCTATDHHCAPFLAVFGCAAKKSVNVGKGGGTAGLDDYIYEAADDDEYDFM
jgi:hypothetical protein